jgi:hypothetical protein
MGRRALSAGLLLIAVLVAVAWWWTNRVEEGPRGDDVPAGSTGAVAKPPPSLEGRPTARPPSATPAASMDDAPTGDPAPAERAVIGRVTTVAGDPVESANVTVCGATQAIDSAITDTDGRFRVAMKTVGAHRLRASHVAIGVAEIASVDIAAKGDTDVGTLRLEPAATIEGDVVLPDGSPAPQQYVGEAPIVKDTTGTCAFVGLEPQTETDERGHFAFRALRPGRYSVGLMGASGEKIVGAGEYETGTHDVRIVVRRRLILLHVEDATGKPISGAECSYEQITDDGTDGGMGAGSFGGGPTLVLEFRSPSRVRILVRTEALEADPLEVEIPADRWRSEATAVLRSKAAHGTIRLDLVDGDGKPVPLFRAEAQALIDGHPTTLIGHTTWNSSEGLVSKPVRPARYVVHVTPGLADDFPRDLGGPCYGVQRAEVTVPPRGEGLVRIIAQAGGWLRATVIPLTGTKELHCGHFIVREGHESEGRIQWLWSDPAKKGLWRGLSSGGPTFLGQPLEPARYVLTASAEGLRDVQIPFEIRANETTDVEVRFTAK